MITTNKKSVQQLLDKLWQKGVQHIVISPGSRNAPMILGFTSHDKYTCLSVPDERVAAFVALGIADETKQPVALVCTSGSALLNYYPAIAEAYYRHIPLIVLSADRPAYLIDQGDGQTIRQKNVFSNHILYSAELHEAPQNKEDEQENMDRIQAALRFSKPNMLSNGGPVHLNMPFEEPLYDSEEYQPNVDSSKTIQIAEEVSNDDVQLILNLWNHAEKRMILIGQMDADTELKESLQGLSPNALILSETTSNIEIPGVVKNIDRLITPFSEEEKESFQPDILITFGGNVVSKRIKSVLRSYQPKNHIHIQRTSPPLNTYQCLTHHVEYTPSVFLKAFAKNVNSESSDWVKHWINLDLSRQQAHTNYIAKAPYSDLTVIHKISQLIPDDSIVHLANSTPVRYAQLLDWKNNLEFKCNRGTSGIDGIVSTAVGNAIASSKQVYLIVGDLSFFYDTNAWWHRHIPQNIKVIVINNAGGGIFRFIDGPNSTGQLENHFETHQKNSVEHIALGFDVNYLCASNLDMVEEQFKILSTSDQAGILEITTPQIQNAEILKQYFKNLIN
ncbi:2-succinyl-5-enolpyruvyl-6-hydroxy-3-cyclohexene-1-carboxylic-acid synthase [bacterium SCSIO 12643]|nr:2-succinyl-5-enolpyruvyl-6-hydroxy-3-cyclohexene-1-carboxylic-acid synthase [bacterium SCSIO 12643]